MSAESRARERLTGLQKERKWIDVIKHRLGIKQKPREGMMREVEGVEGEEFKGKVEVEEEGEVAVEGKDEAEVSAGVEGEAEVAGLEEKRGL